MLKVIFTTNSFLTININFEIQTKNKTIFSILEYVHRIGRTGRMGNLGVATSFFNDKNRTICGDLVELLVETKQEVPNFLEDIMLSERSHGGRRGGSRPRYTAVSRDFRTSNSNRNQNRNGNTSRGMSSGYGNQVNRGKLLTY